ALLGHNPFAKQPPAHIRILAYRYRFTTPVERRQTNAWWVRRRMGVYLAPVRLTPWPTESDQPSPRSHSSHPALEAWPAPEDGPSESNCVFRCRAAPAWHADS